MIPGDGEVIEASRRWANRWSRASAPVIRESGGDRSAGHRRHARWLVSYGAADTHIAVASVPLT